ncbi:Dynein regulatory complex subunit 3 [Cladochytrium tenue]|nr:Dynein regulatory complex subunit 3 [Cladochytrium tenue]
MMGEDQDYQRILHTAPDRLTELQEAYRAKFEVVVDELKQFVLRRHAEKQEEEAMFDECLRTAKADVDRSCRERMDAYSHEKKMMIRVVQSSRDAREIDETLKELKDKTSLLSDFMMGLEMQLVEQFEETTKEFERNYTELCSGVNEHGQACFARLRELENEHHEKFTECVMQTYERFAKGELDDLDDDLRDVLGDKDSLVNAINASHDFRLGKLDHQEDGLVSGTARALDALTQGVHEAEVRRNRSRVCEIVALVERCTAEIEQAEENAF